MATTLEVIVGATRTVGLVYGGTTYNLSNRVEYIHYGNDGFGLPEFERFMESGPLLDGAIDRGFKLKPRKIQLVLNLLAETETEYWNRRSELLEIFMPRKTPIILKITNPVRTYYLDCYTEGGLTFDSTNKQGYSGHRVTVQLVAPDPLFYTAIERLVTLHTGPIIEAGSPIVFNSIADIDYAGNYRTFPLINIRGPISNISIYTFDSDGVKREIKFKPAYSLDDGEHITIDTRPGIKTVSSGLHNLASESDLSSFAVYKIPGAKTRFTVSGSYTGTQTRFMLLYEDKYIGF